jgi:tRNA-2-methylthio-N6-dimethylallyladenosine synthase
LVLIFRYLGREELVLVEAVNPKMAGQVYGRTDGNKLTFLEGGAELIGKMARVRITETRSWSLSGELLGLAGLE